MNSAHGPCACAARSRSNATSCSACWRSRSIKYSASPSSGPRRPERRPLRPREHRENSPRSMNFARGSLEITTPSTAPPSIFNVSRARFSNAPIICTVADVMAERSQRQSGIPPIARAISWNGSATRTTSLSLYSNAASVLGLWGSAAVKLTLWSLILSSLSCACGPSRSEILPTAFCMARRIFGMQELALCIESEGALLHGRLAGHPEQRRARASEIDFPLYGAAVFAMGLRYDDPLHRPVGDS